MLQFPQRLILSHFYFLRGKILWIWCCTAAASVVPKPSQLAKSNVNRLATLGDLMLLLMLIRYPCWMFGFVVKEWDMLPFWPKARKTQHLIASRMAGYSFYIFIFNRSHEKDPNDQYGSVHLSVLSISSKVFAALSSEPAGSWTPHNYTDSLKKVLSVISWNYCVFLDYHWQRDQLSNIYNEDVTWCLLKYTGNMLISTFILCLRFVTLYIYIY